MLLEKLDKVDDIKKLVADIQGDSTHEQLSGKIVFTQLEDRVRITADLINLPPDQFLGFHIHEGSECSGDDKDEFKDVKNHFDKGNNEHPDHLGDLPPIYSGNGEVHQEIETNRFDLGDILGKTIIIHSQRDDFTSQPSGDAGDKIACGEIRKVRLIKEDLRVWGQEDIDDQNALSSIAKELKKLYDKNNITYDSIDFDIFDYGMNIIVRNVPEDDKDMSIDIIELDLGYSVEESGDDLIIDVSQQYEDENGDIRTRVSREYLDEKLNNSEKMIQALYTIPEQEALIKKAHTASNDKKETMIKIFADNSFDEDDVNDFKQLLEDGDSEFYFSLDTLIRDMIIDAIAEVLGEIDPKEDEGLTENYIDKYVITYEKNGRQFFWNGVLNIEDAELYTKSEAENKLAKVVEETKAQITYYENKTAQYKDDSPSLYVDFIDEYKEFIDTAKVKKVNVSVNLSEKKSNDSNESCIKKLDAGDVEKGVKFFNSTTQSISEDITKDKLTKEYIEEILKDYPNSIYLEETDEINSSNAHEIADIAEKLGLDRDDYSHDITGYHIDIDNLRDAVKEDFKSDMDKLDNKEINISDALINIDMEDPDTLGYLSSIYDMVKYDLTDNEKLDLVNAINDHDLDKIGSLLTNKQRQIDRNYNAIELETIEKPDDIIIEDLEEVETNVEDIKKEFARTPQEKENFDRLSRDDKDFLAFIKDMKDFSSDLDLDKDMNDRLSNILSKIKENI